MGENRNRNSRCVNYNTPYGNDKNQAQNSEEDTQAHQKSATVSKNTSLGTLIVWNISKALENNPDIDLRRALNTAQTNLGRESRDVISIMSQYPEERYLACAMLAWQQLGHEDADSLYHFYETKRSYQNNNNIITNKNESYCSVTECKQQSNKDSICSSRNSYFTCYENLSTGPVVKLPVQKKIVMRSENISTCRRTCRKHKMPEKNIRDKIDAVCCLETDCIERLAAVDATTTELRTRAAKLARREAERVELLERADAAWKDLELGYQRRLRLSEEKEDDLSKQIQKLIDERNGYKNACMNIVKHLKRRAEIAEKERAALVKVEKDVYDRACIRLRLSEESGRADAILNENQIKVAQLDRDLQFKEEQTRHKVLSIESELSSARALTHDTERAMRAELGALREQVAQVSNQLLEEDAESVRVKQEIKALEKEKMEMVEDLDGCKLMCDNSMQGKVDELHKKRAQLNELKDKVMECRCQLPIDASIEVKRTPSLAALCKCTPEEKILKSCSCTSLRSRLLSNLLADLFGGLQAEIGGSVSQMPCQLLKCLEDKHNWDRASIVKTNLQTFFSQLLISELDIAIATSIDKYHAKWVGSTCADRAKLKAEPGDIEEEGWEKRVLEERAQKLASELAEQLFQERAEQLTQRAKDIVMSGPPPCTCKPQAIFPCLVKSLRIPTSANVRESPTNVGAPDYLKRTLKYITQLKFDMEDMKKRSIQKEDLKLMDENIVKIMERVTGLDTYKHISGGLDRPNQKMGTQRNNKCSKLTSNISDCPVTSSKQCTKERKKFDAHVFKKGNKSANSSRFNNDILSKSYNKVGQTFAVNLCLCGNKKKSEKISQQCKLMINKTQNDDKISSWKQISSNVIGPHNSTVRHTNPINNLSSQLVYSSETKVSAQTSCKKDCVCFNKLPSNVSIHRLLNNLPKWKFVLRHSVENYIQGTRTNKIEENIKIIDNITKNKNVPEKEKHESNIRQAIAEAKENLCCETKLNDDELCSVSCYEKQEIVLKSDEAEHIVPANDSEYMAAINLEKSNKDYYRCLKNTTELVNDRSTEKIKTSYTRINTDDYICKQSIKSVNSKPIKRNMQASFQSNGVNYHHTSRSSEHINISNKQMEKNISITQNLQNDRQEKNIDALDNSEAHVCDYCINFLGVTLANINANKKNKSSANENNFTKQSIILDDCVTNNIVCNSVSKCILTKTEKHPLHIAYESKTLTSNCKGNLFKQHVEDKNINAHDTANVSILQNTIENEKSCVCCNLNNLDESNNLADNAFSLLEDYFKEKLKDFHTFSCKSSCISPEEEDEMFSGLLKKVKEVISENVKQITCKCFESDRVEPNWNRAYGLLQEYLKVKIKRVQCLCITKESSSLPVNNVLDRVSSLIDHDFQRLKTMCRCNDEKEKIIRNSIICNEEIPVKDVNDYKHIQSLYENYASSQRKMSSCEIMELNTNSLFTENHINHYSEQDNKNYYANNFQTNIQSQKDLKSNNSFRTILDTVNYATENNISREKSKISIILNKNASCQVLPNLGMLSKSCDTLGINTKNAETFCMKSTDCFNKPLECNTDCDCCCGLVKEDNIYLGFERGEVLVNRCTVLEKNDDPCSPINCMNRKLCDYRLLDELHNTTRYATKDVTYNSTKQNGTIDKISPYLGCTIDCSCGERNLSTCICFKSVVQENHSMINEIWRNMTERSCVDKISYLCNKNTLAKGINTEPEFFYKDLKNQSSEDINISEETNDIKKKNTVNTMGAIDQNVCNAKISVHGEDEIILKNSKEHCEQIHITTNTLDETISLENYYLTIESPSGKHESPKNYKYTKNLITNNYEEKSNCSVDKDKYFTKQEIIIGNNTISLSNHSYHDCRCDTVPICHVKMLVENIENNLVNSRCTCDSLTSDVCPTHAIKF